MKTCSKCKESKTLDDFSNHKRSKDGKHGWCKSCMRAASQKWREDNPESWTSWYENNREQRLLNMQEWRENNREKHSRSSANWLAANPDKNRQYLAERRAREVGAAQAYFPTLTELKVLYGESCMFPGCDRLDVQVDHVVPLSLGGSHSGCNAQLLCGSHNASKKHHTSDDYRPTNIVASLPEHWISEQKG